MPTPLVLLAGVTKAYEAITGLSKSFGFGKKTRTGRAYRGRKKVPMKNFLALIGGAVLIVGGLGYHLGWFHVDKIPAAGSEGQYRLQIDVDSNKIKEDVKKGAEKLKDTIDDFTDDEKPGSTNAIPGKPPAPTSPSPLKDDKARSNSIFK